MLANIEESRQQNKERSSEWLVNTDQGYSLPYDQTLDFSKLKAFTDDKTNGNQKMKFVSEKVEKKKMLSHTMFFKSFLSLTDREYAVKGYKGNQNRYEAIFIF